MSDDYPHVPPEALLLVEQIHGMPAVGANADGVENNVILATSARLNHTEQTGTMLLVLGPDIALETIAGLLSAGHHAFGLAWVHDLMTVMNSYPIDDVEANLHKGWTP